MIALRPAEGAPSTGSGHMCYQLTAHLWQAQGRRFDCSGLILDRVAAAVWRPRSQIALDGRERSRGNAVDTG
jgi:hypothetical protein